MRVITSVPAQMALATCTGSNSPACAASDSATATAAALGVVQDGRWMSSTSDSRMVAARCPMISGSARAPRSGARLRASPVLERLLGGGQRRHIRLRHELRELADHGHGASDSRPIPDYASAPSGLLEC